MRFLLIIFGIILPLHGQGLCTTANFEPGPMSEGSLTSEFKGSIFRLQVEGSSDSGTGYLIDSLNGYIITAFHVVASAKPDSVIDVTSPSSSLHGVKLSATLVKSLAKVNDDGTVNGTDLAMLKLANPDLVKTLRPVDVSLRYPSVDQVLYAMGYPQLGDEPNTTFSEQLVKFMASPSDGSIQVTQATFGGNSGGPLIDPSGSVLGTCRESVGIGAAVARYIPMSDGEALLDLVPMSDRMKTLDQQVKAGSILESDLRDLLVKNSSNPSNIELYAWARNIIANRAAYSSGPSKALLQCPMRALMQRGMDDVVIELSSLADPRTVGAANESVAAREIAQGRPLSAETHVQAAAAAYGAVNDAVGTIRTAMLSTRIQLALGSVNDAAAQSQKVLARVDTLPVKDKANAFAIAADVDLAKGNRINAISDLNLAANFSSSAGQYVSAANLLTSSANLSLAVSKPSDAKESLTKAITLYQNGSDKSGEAESVYKLVNVNSALGDTGASTTNLKQYLVLAPDGTHAAEAKELLTSPAALKATAVIK